MEIGKVNYSNMDITKLNTLKYLLKILIELVSLEISLIPLLIVLITIILKVLWHTFLFILNRPNY